MREDRLTTTRSWLQRLFRRSPGAAEAASGVGLTLRPTRTVAGSASYQWEVVVSLNSAPLGGMYADLLRQANIPVLSRGWQTVPMAGAPIGVTLLVPQERLIEARTILGLDEAAEGELTGGAKQLAAAEQTDAEAADADHPSV